MIDTSKTFCSIIFDVLREKGIKNVVCSPGSRNVPLLLAAAARDEFKKHFAVDERSAAFMALGLSMVTKQPVVLICTSGTALLNYAPAVAEAYYQSIPLIVISADRPIQWIDQDDSQTLRQDNALANYVKKSYTIPAHGEEDEELKWFVNRIANDAVEEASTKRKGPVHINIHLGEPLGEKKTYNPEWTRSISTIQADTIANKEILRDLAKKISDSKVMLVAGFGQPNEHLQKEIGIFSKLPNVAIMAETISNLHLEKDDYRVDSVLTALEEPFNDDLIPDVIISIGGALVSRKLKEFLRKNSARCRHWAVGYSHTVSDPFMSLSMRIEMEPSRFFRGLNSYLRKMKVSEKSNNYRATWKEEMNRAGILKDTFVKECGWSELKAFDLILHNLPSNCNLFLSNGTPIRYDQIISHPLPHATYCNRGVSGIDGCTSTAAGGAIAFKGETLLITGDLSFSYDIGALGWKEIPDRFKIIVIDNQGGGIFRFIPSTSKLEEREEYLCQTPILPVRHLAEGYGWKYFEGDDEKSLISALKELLDSKEKSILRVYCEGESSARILKDYMNLK